jgi:hypothetical protein
MAGMRKTLAPEGIAAAAGRAFGVGAQQTSAEQQSLLAANFGAPPESWDLDEAPLGTEGAAEHDVPPQQSSATGMVEVVGGNLDMGALETLKWV